MEGRRRGGSLERLAGVKLVYQNRRAYDGDPNHSWSPSSSPNSSVDADSGALNRTSGTRRPRCAASHFRQDSKER